MKTFIFFCFSLIAFSSLAQNVGIGTATPHASAELDVRGFRLRMPSGSITIS